MGHKPLAGRVRGMAAGLCVLGVLSPAAAAPYTPAHADTVLERLPPALSGASGGRFAALRARLSARPTDPDAAARLAAAYVEQGARLSDPRWFGYAQALLAPWWTSAEPPSAVLLVRAQLRQKRHAFAPAIADLRTLLARDARHVKAWLLLSDIYLVQGKPLRAEAACAALARSAHSVTATLCYAAVMNRSARAARAAHLLDALATQFQGRDDPALRWILTLRAESAQLLGDEAGAQAAYTQALAGAVRDAYLLAAYADFLLDRHREAEVLALLQDPGGDPALLLRAALAAYALGDSRLADAWRQRLRAVFAAEQRRGGTLHRREAALFQLKLERRPLAALQLAEANWAVQKEPLDARLLVEAAQAAGRGEAAQPVREWQAETGLQDVRLERLLNGQGAS